MIIKIDFDSGEAIYVQLCNQIIMGIAARELTDGDSLPSVRQLADMIGVNMHTVNKAYAILREQGFLTLDRRRGAVVYVDKEKIRALEELRADLRIALAKASCKRLTRQEVHDLIDQMYYEADEEIQ